MFFFLRSLLFPNLAKATSCFDEGIERISRVVVINNEERFISLIRNFSNCVLRKDFLIVDQENNTREIILYPLKMLR